MTTSAARTRTTKPRPWTWLIGSMLVSLFCLYQAVPATWFSTPSDSQLANNADRLDYGIKSVADFRVGDEIYAFNHETGQREIRRVVRTYKRTSDHLRILTCESRTGGTQTIKTTDEHPFYSVEHEVYISAKELSPGIRFTDMDGAEWLVTETVREEHPEGIAVYNVEVEGLHNYFVAPLDSGSSPVLAHNTCRAEWESDVGRFRDLDTGQFVEAPRFGSIDMGRFVHQESFPTHMISEYPDTAFEFRVADGLNGPDATVVGGNPGFDHAELKPFTDAGFAKVVDQVGNWDVENVRVFFYDDAGRIWDSGITLP